MAVPTPREPARGAGTIGYMDRKFEEPTSLEGEEVAVPYRPDEASTPQGGIAAAVRAHEGEVLGIEGVEGLAAGADAIVVYTRDRSVAPRVPETIGGYPVEIVVSGTIRAL